MSKAGHVSAGRQVRSDQITGLQDLFAKVQGGVVTDFRGLNMKQMTELRRRFRLKGVSYKVVKNTLTRIAVDNTSYKGLVQFLVGPTGIAYTDGDPIGPFKIASDFAKENVALNIKGGFIEGTVLTSQEVSEVSKMTSKNEVRSQFLSVLNAPAQKLLSVFNAAPQKFVGVLRAQEEKLEKVLGDVCQSAIVGSTE